MAGTEGLEETIDTGRSSEMPGGEPIKENVAGGGNRTDLPENVSTLRNELSDLKRLAARLKQENEEKDNLIRKYLSEHEAKEKRIQECQEKETMLQQAEKNRHAVEKSMVYLDQDVDKGVGDVEKLREENWQLIEALREKEREYRRSEEKHLLAQQLQQLGACVTCCFSFLGSF